MDKRIAITGIGVISNLGHSTEDYWENRKNKAQLAEDITAFDTTVSKNKKAFTIAEFKPKEFIKRRIIKTLDTVTRYCVSAVGNALKDANADFESNEMGLVTGSKYHGIFSIFDIKSSYHEGGKEGVSPIYFPGTVFNASAGQAAIEWKITGPNCVINTGFSSGLSAICKGADYIRMGRAKLVASGGHEMFHEYIHTKYDKLNQLSSGEKTNPFDKNASGFMLGEGACYVTLENDTQAFERNANVYAYIENYNQVYCPENCEQTETLAECIQNTLKNNTQGVDLIISDACGNCEWDAIQAEAIQKVFGENTPKVTSNKPSIGQTIGASGAFNVLEGILSLSNQAVAPITEVNQPVKDLNLVTEYTEQEINKVLVLSYDPNGNMASMLISK
jgi:3-oxoacyl-[acyl-carrier-protein] synthase II